MEDIEFDAWYTNRKKVLQSVCKQGQILAKRIRQDHSFTWEKGGVSDAIFSVLEKYDVAPNARATEPVTL